MEFYKDNQLTIYNGDALEVLKTLEDKSVNCVITSPPYWALRNYQTEPQIWDAGRDCEHEWGDNIPPRGHKSGKPGPNATVGARFAQDDYRRGEGTNFCIKCGAWKGSFGLEPTFELYIKHLCDIFDEVKRILRKDGTCWVNMGDTYFNKENNNRNYLQEGNVRGGGEFNIKKEECGIETKSLCQIPNRFSIEMTNRGWILRNEIIWYKPNCMPASVKDRFTVDFEKIFFFVKNKKYWFEQQFEPQQEESHARILRGVSDHHKNLNVPGQTTHSMHKKRAKGEGEPLYNPLGRNKRCVWRITTKGYSEAHFATFPEELIVPMVKAGCPEGGIVLDPFMGSGTTCLVANKLNRKAIGIELNQSYCEMALKRCNQKVMEL